MPSASLPQRIAEISEELENLRAQSLHHPEKAVEMLQDCLEQLQVSLKELTISAGGGGMTEAERDAFVEDKLTCEHEKSLARQEKLLDATRKVLAQRDLIGLLQTVADCARELTGAKYAATGHGYVNGVFATGGASHSEGAMPCPLGEAFNVNRGGVYLDLVKEKDSIRFTDAEMRSHPTWWGLPEGHVPLRGLLGARLVDVNGQPNGLLMVSDKEDGTDFTTEDENTLSQLAAIVSLALQHIEARLDAENKERRLEALMKALPVGVSFSDDPTCQSITGNPAVLAQFEVRPEDNLSASAPNGNAPGRQVRYFMDGRQITDAELPLQRAVTEKHEIPPMELKVELPNGRQWFTEASGAPILDAQGNVIGGVAVTEDITDRKRAEDALRESEEKYHSLFTTMSEAFGLIDLIRNKDGRVIDYVFLDVNPAWEQISGIEREDAVGRNAKNLFGVVEDYWLEMFDWVNRTAEPKRLEDYGGGMGRYYSVIAWKVAEDRVAHTFTDITERKRAEERVLALQKVASALAQVLTPEQVGDVVLTEGMRVMGAQAATVGILVAGSQVLDIRISMGVSDEVMAKWQRHSLDKRTMLTDAVRMERTILRGSLAEWETVYPDSYPAMCAHGLNAAAATPLKTGDQLLGGIIFYFADAREFKDDEVAFLEAIAGQTAQALERAQLYELTQKHVAELNQVNEKLIRQNRLQEGINRILHEAITCNTEEELGLVCLSVAEELTEGKIGFIGELHQDGQLYDITISNPGWELCTMYDKTGHRKPPGQFKIHGLYGNVLEHGRSLLTNDPAAHPDSIGIPEGHPPLTAFLGVPLVDMERTIGLIAVGNREGGFLPEHQEILEALAPAIVQALFRKRAEESLQNAKEELEVSAEELRLQNDELLRAQLALQESEAKLKSLAENVPCVLMRFDRQLRVVYLSKQSDRYNPNPVERMIGRTNREMGMPEHLCDLWDAAIEQVFSTGTQEEMVFNLVGPSGMRTFELKFAPEFGPDHEVQYVLGVSSDITDRKRAEEELRYHANLVDNVSDAIISTDRELKIRSWNKAAERMYGWQADEVIGQLGSNVLQTTFPEGLSREAIARDIFEKGGWEGELIQRTKDGRDLTVYARSMTLKDEAGNVIGGVSISHDITERKRAEERLAYQANLLTNITDVIYSTDEQLRLTSWNHSAEKVYGWKEEEVLGRNVVEVTGSKFDPEMRSRLARVLAETGSVTIEVEHTTRSGKSAIFESKTMSMSNTLGKVVGFVAVNRDITERKAAEERLRRHQAEIQTLLENTPAGLVLFEATHPYKVLAHNRYYQELFAEPFRSRGMVGLNVHEYAPAVEAEGVVAVFDEVVRTKQPKSFLDFPYKSDPPKQSWFNWHMSPLILDGQVVALVSMSLDVTDRHRAEEALQESEERFRKVFEHSAFGMVIGDMEGRVLESNPAIEHMLGYSKDELRNKPSSDFTHPDDSMKEWQQIEKIIAGQTDHYEIEKRYIRKDGQTIWVRLIGSLTRDNSGNPLVGIALIEDITERKAMEKELRRSRDELELRVRDRTADLSKAKEELEVINEELQVELEEHRRLESELIKAKDLALEAVQAKAAFLANMSHEIRTPMNSIIGFTELLLDEPLSPEQKDNLETIRINGDALLTIINDILDFSKMESDKVVLEEYQFNLRSCVEESLDLVAIRAAEKGINLAYMIEKDVPDTIIGDSTRLRQVLGNLLSNAVKFTDEGEVTLSVSVDGIEDNEIHFAVQDTGIGIPPDSMDLLFQPFSQMEPSTTRLYGGTGLGLAISRRLVELMGGKIWAESEAGKGSTFHFTIKVPSESGSQPVEVSPQLVGKHVLIIEDNKTNRRILGKQVYDWGMIPMVASSGQEALKYIRRGDDFDIAILDMDLQTMDSLELEREIRKYNKKLPLVLLTSLGKRIPPDHAYLTKPIRPSQMHRVLTDILPKTVIMPKEPDKRPVKTYAADQTIQNSLLKILLAEDNVSSQKVALLMLKKLGYKADVAANGIEVLQSLERKHYDVVLMDLRMPEMGGLEATRIIRQRWPDNGPKIIAITAYALEGDREKCLEAGMNDYIAKPIQKEDLARALKDINRL